MEARSRYHSCHGKAISVTFAQCVFVHLGIQQAKRMCPERLYNFSTLSHTRQDFGGKKKVIGHKMCVLTFLLLSSETTSNLKRIKRDIITNLHMSSCTVPAVLVRF